MRSPIEVAVIGAGMAGLAAARELAAHGVGVEVFEASGRVGGRAHTLHHDGEALPVELGPEFVFGRPKSTLALASEAHAELDEVDDHVHVVSEGELVSHAGLGDHLSLVPQARVHGGYSQLVDWLASRVRRRHVVVRTHSVVRAIRWAGDAVELELRHKDLDETATATRAIVTLPIGVLQTSVHFDPGLGEHAAAIDSVAMGPVVKLVLCMRDPVWRAHAPQDLEFVHASTTAFPLFWVQSQDDTHQLTAWASGPHASALVGLSLDQLIELALTGFADTLHFPRAELAAALRDRHFHDYVADPYARGAYSLGGNGAAEVLQRPLGNKLFFAGEATDPTFEGTVEGALASGIRAARQILQI